mgnify:CR=1 FL=1
MTWFQKCPTQYPYHFFVSEKVFSCTEIIVKTTYADIKEHSNNLQLEKNSRVICISTHVRIASFIDHHTICWCYFIWTRTVNIQTSFKILMKTGLNLSWKNMNLFFNTIFFVFCLNTLFYNSSVKNAVPEKYDDLEV